MGIYGTDVCDRCMTTHPLNEAGERPCPKPPIEETEGNPDGIGVIFKGSGYCRTSKYIIKSHGDVM